MFLSVILSALRLARRGDSIGVRRTRRGSTLSNAAFVAIVLWFSGCDGQVPTTQGPWAKAYSADQISPSVRAATSGDLLYVSSDAPYVYIYTYPGLAYVSKLDILGGNSGLCDDAAGDVFVTIYNLVLGDLDHPNLYRLQLSGSSLKVVGSTKLRTGKNVEQFTIAADTSGETLIGPNSTAQSVYFWRYPRGGKPMQQITGLSGAFGTAISKGSPQATSTRTR
jgi:hypothetical protein